MKFYFRFPFILFHFFLKFYFRFLSSHQDSSIHIHFSLISFALSFARLLGHTNGFWPLLLLSLLFDAPGICLLRLFLPSDLSNTKKIEKKKKKKNEEEEEKRRKRSVDDATEPAPGAVNLLSKQTTLSGRSIRFVESNICACRFLFSLQGIKHDCNHVLRVAADLEVLAMSYDVIETPNSQAGSCL